MEKADCANEEGLEIRQQSSTSMSQMPDKKIESRFEKQIKRSKMERFTHWLPSPVTSDRSHSLDREDAD